MDALPPQAIRRCSTGSFLLNVVNDGIMGDTTHTHGQDCFHVVLKRGDIYGSRVLIAVFFMLVLKKLFYKKYFWLKLV